MSDRLQLRPWQREAFDKFVASERPDFLARVAALARAGQVELLGELLNQVSLQQRQRAAELKAWKAWRRPLLPVISNSAFSGSSTVARA